MAAGAPRQRRNRSGVTQSANTAVGSSRPHVDVIEQNENPGKPFVTRALSSPDGSASPDATLPCTSVAIGSADFGAGD